MGARRNLLGRNRPDAQPPAAKEAPRWKAKTCRGSQEKITLIGKYLASVDMFHLARMTVRVARALTRIGRDAVAFTRRRAEACAEGMHGQALVMNTEGNRIVIGRSGAPHRD